MQVQKVNIVSKISLNLFTEGSSCSFAGVSCKCSQPEGRAPSLFLVSASDRSHPGYKATWYLLLREKLKGKKHFQV